eukprot:474605_1
MLSHLVTHWNAGMYHDTNHAQNALHVAARDGSPKMVETIVRLIRETKATQVCEKERCWVHKRVCSKFKQKCIGGIKDEEGVSLWERVQIRPELLDFVRRG